MLCVLTYDAPHRKTQDLLMMLRASGYDDILVLATPWKARKSFQPRIPHRPSDPLDLGPGPLSRNLGYEFGPCTLEELPALMNARTPELLLIGGAGILPAEVVQSLRIVNSHPGLLPGVRGLDALKWAIHDGAPIGVTSHLISEEADAGFLIDRQEVPLHPWDTFQSVAHRQYRMEIRMLVEAIPRLREGAELQPLDPGAAPVHRRMPHRLERELEERLARRIQGLDPPKT